MQADRERASAHGIGLIAEEAVDHRRLDEAWADAVGADAIGDSVERHDFVSMITDAFEAQ